MKKPKKEKKVDPDNIIAVEFLQQHYDIRYKELLGIPALINWGKDVKFISKLLKTYSDPNLLNCNTKYELLVKVCERFFICNDPFVIKKVWDLHSFYLLFPKLVLQLKNNEDGILKEIADGYKLAYWNHNEQKLEMIPESWNDVFSQLYIFIKPYYREYGSSFSLDRFSEIYFLIIMDYLKDRDYGIAFFIGKFAQNLFKTWIEENHSDLQFFPKDIGKIDKEKLNEELKKLQLEESSLLK